MLPVRLVPNPNTADETYLYGTLYRDLRQGLQLALGQPLPKPWQDCLNTVDDTTGREVREGEFEYVLEALLDGPIEETQQHLVLVVEGLSRAQTHHVESWGRLMNRLIDRRLKLVIWGGEELYWLCNVDRVQQYSVFHKLRQLEVKPFSQTELTRLAPDLLGVNHYAEFLYEMTHGHPALVYEHLQAVVDAPQMLHADDWPTRS